MSNNLIYKIKQCPIWFRIIVLKIVWHINLLAYLRKLAYDHHQTKQNTKRHMDKFVYSLKVFTDHGKILGVQERLKKTLDSYKSQMSIKET